MVLPGKCAISTAIKRDSLTLSMAPIPLEARRKALLVGINYDSEGETGALEGSHHNVHVLKHLLISEQWFTMSHLTDD